MIADAESLPDDIELLKTLVLEARHELARSQNANARLWETLRQLQRAQFGRKSEKLDPDQFNFAVEDAEQALAEAQSQDESADATLKASRKKPRSVNRGALPAHLPREEIIVEPEDKACPCCGNAMHVMGEDRSERLDVIPAQFKVIVTRRPKYACRACEEAVVQAPAPARLIEGGIPTESLIAHVLVSKYADHCPLYRQAQIYARQGIELDRSTLADWVGWAAALLAPVQARLFEILKSSPKLFADETRAGPRNGALQSPSRRLQRHSADGWLCRLQRADPIAEAICVDYAVLLLGPSATALLRDRRAWQRAAC